jgi:hypothetical protein
VLHLLCETTAVLPPEDILSLGGGSGIHLPARLKAESGTSVRALARKNVLVTGASELDDDGAWQQGGKAN